jgi:predicted N-acyltransferase
MWKLKTHRSMRDIGEAQWQALWGHDAEPHLNWAFLDALERSGCVAPEAGWTPLHLGLYGDDDQLVAAAPAYLKTNSEGEFVFDQGWADFAERRLHLDYYPKLLVAVPFTPATGRRILVRPGSDGPELRAALLEGLTQLCSSMSLSSAHVLFPTTEESNSYGAAQLLHRHGVQYHWYNPGYASFADFLGRFSAKRRHQIRRERRAIQEQGVQIEVLSGREVTPALLDHVYDFYCSTVQRHFYGRQYLNRAFFEEICARMPNQILLVLARAAGGAQPIAGAFNLVGGGVLYGRYWGAREEREFLHFEVCYYRGAEESIARGLRRFEPGAGGEHKLARGFEPTVTHSFHWIHDARLGRAVDAFLEHERRAIATYREQEGDLLKPWPTSDRS